MAKVRPDRLRCIKFINNGGLFSRAFCLNLLRNINIIAVIINITPKLNVSSSPNLGESWKVALLMAAWTKIAVGTLPIASSRTMLQSTLPA